VLQCVAVCIVSCCRRVAVICSVCCSALHWVDMCVLQSIAVFCSVYCIVLQSMLQ